MVVVESVPVAVLLCVVTMLCWGSWANTQKAVGQRWRFELFYWDYVFGVVLASLIFAFTLGSMGSGGRGFLADLAQADSANFAPPLPAESSSTPPTFSSSPPLPCPAWRSHFPSESAWPWSWAS